MRDAAAVLDRRKVRFDVQVSPQVALERSVRTICPSRGPTADANVLITPDLRAALMTSWPMHRLSGGIKIGPLSISMAQPVQVMPADASVSQIVCMACLASYQAAER